MGLNFRNLDGRIRMLMAEEIASDIAYQSLHIPSRLSQQGQASYPTFLRESAATGSDVTLAAKLRARGMLNATEKVRTRTGMVTSRIAATAADAIADAEFNRFYVRAICRAALENGVANVVIYYAGKPGESGSEVELGLGRQVDAAHLLNNLRNAMDLDDALDLHSGRHPGLSVALP